MTDPQAVSEMVQKVAKALAEFSQDEVPDWAPDWTLFIGEAGVAINAMREPTRDMVEAGDERHAKCWSLEPGEGYDENPTLPVYQAMIDAALKEGESSP